MSTASQKKEVGIGLKAEVISLEMVECAIKSFGKKEFKDLTYDEAESILVTIRKRLKEKGVVEQ